MDLFRKSAGYRFLDAFVLANGGFRERLSDVRSVVRTQVEGVPKEGPACPACGGPTRLRKTRNGNRPFWGCTGYPACRGLVECA